MIKLDSGLDAYIATAPADKAHKGTGIVYIADIFGIWANSKLMADQFAANGYTTIIPDIFNGDVMPLPMPEGLDIMSWITKGAKGDNPHTPAQIDPIIDESIKALKAQGATKIGAVGYCFGAKVCPSISTHKQIANSLSTLSATTRLASTSVTSLTPRSSRTKSSRPSPVLSPLPLLRPTASSPPKSATNRKRF